VTDGPDPFEHDDAAYVLGALTHDDRIAYEQHLRTCARCSAAVAELAALPGLLARLPGLPEAATTLPPPPDTVLPALLGAVRRQQIRRRAWGAAAGLAAAAVLVTATVVVTDQVRPSTASADDAAGMQVAMVGMTDPPVDVDLRMQDVAWGTRITMTCRYEKSSGPHSDESYQLVVVPTGNGIPQSVARWLPVPGRDVRVTGSTDLPADDIAEVQLRDDDGTLLLQGWP
jgi:hypothetical protein